MSRIRYVSGHCYFYLVRVVGETTSSTSQRRVLVIIVVVAASVISRERAPKQTGDSCLVHRNRRERASQRRNPPGFDRPISFTGRGCTLFSVRRFERARGLGIDTGPWRMWLFKFICPAPRTNSMHFGNTYMRADAPFFLPPFLSLFLSWRSHPRRAWLVSDDDGREDAPSFFTHPRPRIEKRKWLI